MKTQVIVTSTKQNTTVRNHPWIYPKAIKNHIGNLVTGELVEINNEAGEFLGVGAYNENSLYRVRVLARAKESVDMSSYKTLIKHRLLQANQVRLSINLPNEQTTAYRLFNSEADGLSGLTIDRFNRLCVVSSSAYWVELNKELIIQNLQELYSEDEVIWLPQIKLLQKEGWDNSIKTATQTSMHVLEAGIVYEVAFSQAQKTGLFLDQRENHRRIGELSKGKRVLDLYTYTGGFALHAAKGGALAVTAIDSSEQAIAQAVNNATLNKLSNIEFIEADARDYLQKAGEYDVIILDPPKLVPSRKHLEKAKNYYRFLHRELFKNMRDGSLLMTCNCSAALSSQDFCALVSAQAEAVGKQVRILGIYGPASCHPTLSSFPEGNYLTAILFAIV